MTVCNCIYSVEETSAGNLATLGLARVGAQAALSFTFAFLKRAWRYGEDSELCAEVLQDALVTMRTLPVALLFDISSVSPIWLEVVDRSMKFLMDMQKRWVGQVGGEKALHVCVGWWWVGH